MNTNRGTSEGDTQEIKFVQYYNRNKHNKIFSTYNQLFSDLNLENVYLNRVVTKQYSRLSNQVVMTRADAYAIIINSNIDGLLKKTDFYLDENILKDNKIPYKFIEKSGISIKLSDSKKFQILKLTPNSFKSLFGQTELGAAASLYCKKEEELVKNKDVIAGWLTTNANIQNFFKELNLPQNFDLNSSLCQLLKTNAENKIKEIIDNSDELQKKIFNGIGLYDEPYTAHYFFSNQELKKLNYIPFQVTTGSGRSKKVYTIVLKP